MHALNMGREYSEPFRGLGRSYPDEIGQLCGFVCMLGCALSLGIGQGISICGNYGANFAACFTCHAREKLRRQGPTPSRTNSLCSLLDRAEAWQVAHL